MDQSVAKITEKKCDLKAKEHREVGNSHFQKKKYVDSLINYNKSIAFAETNKVLSLGYGNRSAVYFEIKLYEDCLKNIDLARKHEYPKEKMKKLVEREEKCHKLMQQQEKVEDPMDFFKLSYPANPKIPSIVEGLIMRRTVKYGRGIFATKDFKAGDIISIEEPLISVACERDWYIYCSNCFKTSNLNLIPCNKTASMMFCSTDCMEALHAKDFDMTKIARPDIKFATELATLFGGNSKFYDILKATDLRKLQYSIFDFDWANKEDPNYHENLRKCVLSLSHNCPEYVAQCYNYILSDEYPELVAGFLFGLKSLNSIVIPCFNNFPIKLSFSLSLFQGLINHSCIDNVEVFFVQNKMATIVTKPIKAGEQIFRSYIHPSVHRLFKNGLLLHHQFKCKCTQCMDTYIAVEPKLPRLDEIINKNKLPKARELLMQTKLFANRENISQKKAIYYQRLIGLIFKLLSDFTLYPCAYYRKLKSDK